MTIILNNIRFELKEFSTKSVLLNENYPLNRPISKLLRMWILGVKKFEIYTSGSTGVATKIILKREWLETSALQTINLLNLWNEIVLCCLPTNKIGGLMMIIRSIVADFDIQIIEPKSDPMVDISSDHPFTFVSLVPSQLKTILESTESTKKLNRFKNILLGGSDINIEILNRIQTLKPNIYHTYGMTETCSHIALKKLNNDAWPHFKPNPFVELKTNNEGWLSIKAYQTGDEWVNTKDIVKLYSDGCFDFIGRADFLINTGGFKVFPEQLEIKIGDIFNAHKMEIEFAICSKLSDKWGEEIVLVIKSNLYTDNEIFKVLKLILLNYELPKKIFRLESIPVNKGGKKDRIKLREIIRSIC